VKLPTALPPGWTFSFYPIAGGRILLRAEAADGGPCEWIAPTLADVDDCLRKLIASVWQCHAWHEEAVAGGYWGAPGTRP
jgi:hypothetical protein